MREREREKKPTIGGYKAPNCSQWFDFCLNSAPASSVHHHLLAQARRDLGWKKSLSVGRLENPT